MPRSVPKKPPVLFTLTGTVRPGRQLGRTAGHPTVNFPLDSRSGPCPDRGVYAAFVTLPDSRIFRAVTNVGVRPTVEEAGALWAESHLLHFTGDLYGQTITVCLSRFLRPEKKFASFEALQAEIANNVGQTDRYFDELHFPG